MGSKADLEWSKKIADKLAALGVDCVLRVASAHKVPLKCMEILKEYEDQAGVFITVAGRSNALSGFVDAQTEKPVIACPPYGEKFAGADVFSSISMPSGVAPLLSVDPGNAALAAAKILALSDEGIKEKVENYQRKLKDSLENDDEEVRNGQR